MVAAYPTVVIKYCDVTDDVNFKLYSQEFFLITSIFLNYRNQGAPHVTRNLAGYLSTATQRLLKGMNAINASPHLYSSWRKGAQLRYLRQHHC